MGFAALPLASKIALGAMAASTAANAYNTQKTAKRQDAAAAQAIRNQSEIQRRADAAVNEEVQSLQGSSAEGDRKQRMDDYMAQLMRNRASTAQGLQPSIGGDAFKADSATALQGVDARAAGDAGLMARMDAAGMQRMREGTSTGHLGTNISMLGRESKGQQFIDEMRMRGIRRNGGLDFASGLLGAVGSGMAGGMSADAGGLSFVDTPKQVLLPMTQRAPSFIPPNTRRMR